MIITVPIIGTGTEEDMWRPDTAATSWKVISRNGDEMTIEIPEEG